MAYEPTPQNQQQQDSQKKQENIVIGESALTPIFTDGAVRINIIGDAIRIDFCTLTMGEDNKLIPVITTKVTMSVAGFAKTAEIVEDYIGKLIQAGIIKKS